ncbi:hypothetical protein V500_05188 [Pseudogymnoascus sp. VKM F-4518 (FW-2643)]|nr:hypothetical protein V500_05188 [Pseudogymnoascus sp. VKM F-4518 (FW-2643)]
MYNAQYIKSQPNSVALFVPLSQNPAFHNCPILLLINEGKDLEIDALSRSSIGIIEIHKCRMRKSKVGIEIAVRLLEEEWLIGKLTAQVVPLVNWNSKFHHALRSDSTVRIDVAFGFDDGSVSKI